MLNSYYGVTKKEEKYEKEIGKLFRKSQIEKVSILHLKPFS